MLRGRVKRTVKWATLGSALIGSGYLLQKNDWEMSTVGVVRFGRAAVAVGFLNDGWIQKILSGRRGSSQSYVLFRFFSHQCFSQTPSRELC